MIQYIELDSDNCKILNYSTAPFKDLEELLEYSPNRNYRVVNIEQFFQDSYWDGFSIVRMPEKPSPIHKFNYQLKQWELDANDAWKAVRAQRNILLAETDWLRLRELDTGVPTPQAWLDYRQALRDITDQPDPLNIVWPSKPET